MSTTYKFIIPLLNENITLKDISNQAGFVDIYSEDINRPYLDNHIFLMYDMSTTKEAFETNIKLKSMKNLYNVYNIKINNNSYTLYAFTITSKSIKNIKRNAFSFSDKEKMRIFAFWNFTDINAFMLNPMSLLRICFVSKVVPEEDYIPSCELVYDEESGALQYRNVPL